MEKHLEATGKTIDAAIQSALNELGLDRDQVSVEVLEKPKAGFLGLGAAQARVRVSYGVSKADRVETFLTGLLKRMGSSAEIVIAEQDDGNLNVEFVGSGLGLLIGHRGDTLDAIQHLTNYVVNRGEETPVRVDVDAEHYREKRVEALKRLAQKTGEKVLKQRRNVTLESMNAYERHIIHTALQETAGISTHSVGMEPNRRVVVSCGRGANERSPHSGGKPRPGVPGSRSGSGYGDRSRGRTSGAGRSTGDGNRNASGAPRQNRKGDSRAVPNSSPAQNNTVPDNAAAAPRPVRTSAPQPGPGNPRPYDRISGTTDKGNV